jgi:phosphatidylserine decarboxylase
MRAPPESTDVTPSRFAGRCYLEGLKVWTIAVGLLSLVLALPAILFPQFGSFLVGLGLVGSVLLTAALAVFFRDFAPAATPVPEGAVLAPAHGQVDFIDEKSEEIMGGRCVRVAIYLSLKDVHVQYAPIAGRVTHLKDFPGKFQRAIRRDYEANRNTLFRFEDDSGNVVGLRLIAGLLVRRIVPWVRLGDRVSLGQRISLIRFGSRADLYLPLGSLLQVRPGDRLVGGETLLAVLPTFSSGRALQVPKKADVQFTNVLHRSDK